MAEIEKTSSCTLTPNVTTAFSLTKPAEVILFHGVMDAWELSEGHLTLKVTNILSTWQQRTLSVHSSSCRWKLFKGNQCGYTGPEAQCDRSYTRCEGLGNQANFGGFRFLPDLVDKEIWWGRVPEKE